MMPSDRPRTFRAVALAAIAAAAALAWLRAERVGDAPGGPADSDGRPLDEARILASPTAPPPWDGSAVAAVVAGPAGPAIALFDSDGALGPDGGPPRVVADGFEAIGRITSAADGDRLAFAARRDGRWDVFTVPLAGGRLDRLTDDPAYDADPAWSPDGTALAFASYRDGNLDIYRLDVPIAGPAGAASPPQSPLRLTQGDAPAIEPAWSPDGATIAFAAWHDGSYRIEAVPATGGERRVLVDPAPDETGDALAAGAADTSADSAADTARRGATWRRPARLPDDLRSPSWSPDGGSLAYLAGRHGALRLDVQAVGVDGTASAQLPSTLAPQAAGFGWAAGGQAVAVVTADRGGRSVMFRNRVRFGRDDIAQLPGDPVLLSAGAAAVAWSPLSADTGLPALDPSARAGDPRSGPSGSLSAGATTARGAAADAAPIAAGRPGLADLPDVRVSGPRINAALFDDFAALRTEVRAATGADFLGTLSDMWRPVGFFSSASAYFSWHKTGRAFDTQMELRGPGGRRDMVLVREDNGGGGPQWRMYLRADAQDGSVGTPLTVPGWAFSAGGGDETHEADGGVRGNAVPDGYWVDFTALAAAKGWRRIAALGRPALDWRTDWAAIEYWHYERRDGLRWFEAARQVYADDDLADAFGPDRLEALSIPLSRLARQGFPAGWRGEG
ncbi:MAG: PD40 domain-containing protein [Ardenticatenales bacterium]|nr:PD40 domain-containing protein [Ardenticatenales bacterium]